MEVIVKHDEEIQYYGGIIAINQDNDGDLLLLKGTVPFEVPVIHLDGYTTVIIR